jgi:2'-5' RNA ligase
VLRLFFALQPAYSQSAELVARVQPLVSALQGQPVPASNLHATLSFLGAVPPERVDFLRAAVGGVRGRRVTLCFDELEHWPKPKILCATARESPGSAHASQLAQRIGETLAAAGFTPDPKPFRAHLTLARKVDASRARQGEWPRDLSPPVEVHCDQFVLMRSDRSEAGSIYSVIASWPLDEC